MNSLNIIKTNSVGASVFKLLDKLQTLKTPIPAASSEVLRGFAPSGTGALKYSFRASPDGTYGSSHSSHQQAGGYSGKRNKNLGGSVFGKTSSGIFVKTLTDQIVFITHLPFSGPLTINLNQDNANQVDLIKIGMEVNFTPEKLSIPEIGLDILVSKDDLYFSPLPSAPVRSKEERHKTIRFTASQMNSYLDEEDIPHYSSLLKIISYGDNNSKLSQSSDFNHISQIVNDIKKHQFEKALEGINKLLGVGEGLTPSGDDIVIGIILSINRYKDVLVPNIDLGKFNQQVIRSGYGRTTTLSANLIECAAHGEADERLVNTVDFLMKDLPNNRKLVADLLNWGNSSGIFVFFGMAITLMRMDT